MSKSLTRKIIFLISLLLLFLFTIGRYLGNFFIDQESLDRSFIRHLPYIIIAALPLGASYIIFFKKTFPEGWNQQTKGGKVAVVFIFPLLAFAILRQGSITLNLLLQPSGKENFQGVVINKEIEETSKGAKFYHIMVNVTGKNETKTMDVSKKIYDKHNVGDTFQKEIITGYFGIKYINE